MYCPIFATGITSSPYLAGCLLHTVVAVSGKPCIEIVLASTCLFTGTNSIIAYVFDNMRRKNLFKILPFLNHILTTLQTV